MSRNVNRVAHKRVPTSMMNSPFNDRIEVDDIDGEACTLGERAKFVIDRLSLDGIQRNECRLAGTLIAHVLDE